MDTLCLPERSESPFGQFTSFRACDESDVSLTLNMMGKSAQDDNKSSETHAPSF